MHTSINYNGWVEANPNGYTGVGHNVHGKWENVFLPANIKAADVAALVAKPHVLDDVFSEYVAYLRNSHFLVEKTYQFEKAGGFDGKGTQETIQFTNDRLAAAASNHYLHKATSLHCKYPQQHLVQPPCSLGVG